MISNPRGKVKTKASPRTKKEKKPAPSTLGNDFFKTMFEKNFLPSWVYDLDSQRFLDVNPAAIRHYGYSRTEFLTLSLHQLRITKEHEQTLTAFSHDGPVTLRNETHQKKDKSIVEVEVTSQELTVDDKRVCMETIHDISERNRQEQQQKILVEISKAAIVSTTLSDLYRSVHQLIKEIMVAENCWFGLYSQGDEQLRFPYFSDRKLHQPPPRFNGKELEEYVIRSQQSFVCTKATYKELIRKNEVQSANLFTKVWLGVPLRVQQTTIGVLVVHDYDFENTYGKHELELLEFVASQVANAIERRLAVLAIREHESNLSALIENTKDAIWSLDTNFSVVTFNTAARSMFQRVFSVEIAEGMQLIDALAGITDLKWKQLYDRALGNERFTIEEDIKRGGLALSLEISFNPILNERGTVEGVSVFAKDISVRKRSEEHQAARTETIIHRQKVLARLAKSEYSSLDQALFTISQIGAETLNVKQVSIWSFTEDGSEIVCEASSRSESGTNVRGMRLEVARYPNYFMELNTSHAVVAEYAESNPSTKEFFKDYLEPFGIVSMMDVPVHLDGKVVAIVCHEHIGIPRKWSLEEQDFAQSIAEYVSITLESERRKSMENALRESEERYRTYLSQTSEATWRYELKKPISTSLPVGSQVEELYDHAYLAECNDAMAIMFGYTEAEEITGRGLSEILLPSEQQNIDMLEEFIHAGYRLSDVETIERDKHGNQKYFLKNLLGIVKDGCLVRVWGTQRDITERKRVENELMRLAHAIRSISECVCITDLENNVIFINDSFATTFLPHGEAILGKKFTEFLERTNDPGKVKEIVDSTLHGSWQGEILTRRVTGEMFTSHLSASVIKDESGQPIALIDIASDIEERKRAVEAVRESELRFRVLAETVAAAIIIYEGENFIYVNPATEELLGYTRDQLYTMKFWEIVHPDFQGMIRTRGMARQSGEHVPSRYEFKIVSRSGEERWVDFTAAVINYQGSQAVLGTAFDITQKKRVEHLQTAVYRIAQAAEAATDLEELYPAVHRIIEEVMPAKNFYIALYDDQKDMVSFPYFVDEEDTAPPPRKSRRGLTEFVIRTGRALLSDLHNNEELIKAGEIEVIGALSPIWLGVPLIIGRKPIGIMTVQHYSDPHAYGEDERQMLEYVSTQVAKAIERKRTEELLRANEKRFRALIENSSDVVVMIDDKGKILYESPAIHRVLGYNNEERFGEGAFSLIHPEDIEKATHLFGLIREQEGATLKGEVRAKHANGSWRWLEVVGLNFLSDPNIKAIVVNYRDITERRQADEALRDSEERFRSLVESATDAIFTLSLNGSVTSLNRAFERLTGWKCEQWIGRSITTLLHEEDGMLANRAFEQTSSGKQPPAYELRVKTSEGEFIICEFTSTPLIQKGQIVGVLGIARDITERKKLEDQIRYIQKMESIGILAGGVAHDFNNILAIINAYAGSLKMIANLPASYAHNIEIIEKTVKRGARIVQQLLTLARKNDTVFTEITICPIIDELTKLMKETFPKTITFTINNKDCDEKIAADSNQIYQVLLNLCLNARDAMSNGGTLTLSTEICDGGDVTRKFPEATDEHYLSVSISDSGVGMDEETKAHIFEPFFTTKEIGKGTGLGLSVVYGIVQNHKGFIDVITAEGQGTTFVIYLPLPKVSSKEVAVPPVVQQEMLEGDETLLLVEDEENLLDLLAEVFIMYGYKILKARDGEEAVRVFKEHKNEIRLVLTDLGLPKLGGYEAFQIMKKINPKIRVILASGYKDSKVSDEMIHDGAEAFVQKPYNISEVIKRIRDLLDSE